MPPTPKAEKGEAGPRASTKDAPTSPGQYRYIGDHAQILESGQPVGHGDYVTLGPDDITGINQMLIDDGKLIDASDIDISGDQPQADSEGVADPAPDIQKEESK